MSEYEEAKARMKKDWRIYNEAMPDNSALVFIQAADKEIARLNNLLINSKVAWMLDKQREEIATKDAELARLREALDLIAEPTYSSCADVLAEDLAECQRIARAALKSQ